MDSKAVFALIFLICIQIVCSFNFEDRIMSDCWSAGIRCSNHSSCKFDLDKNNLTCFCVAGFKGDLCDEDRNECDIGSAPCKKRGVCHNSIGSFRCDCLPGWVGSHCERSDGSGQSVCLTGYTGVNCTEDFDECTQWAENPCEHGSTCVNAPGNFSCRCAVGWEGRICNEDINECGLTSNLCHNGGNCTNIPGAYRCDCPYPYTGVACDDISTTQSTTTSTTTTTMTTTPAPIKSTSHIRSVLSTDKPTSKTLIPSASGTTLTPASTKSSTLVRAGLTTATKENGPIVISTITSMTYSNESTDSQGKPGKPTPSLASPLKSPSGDSTGDSGGSNTGAIVGAVVGILIICGAVGTGILVYHKFIRKPQKVGTEKATDLKNHADTGDTNKNTKWSPTQQQTTENTDNKVTEDSMGVTP